MGGAEGIRVLVLGRRTAVCEGAESNYRRSLWRSSEAICVPLRHLRMNRVPSETVDLAPFLDFVLHPP